MNRHAPAAGISIFLIKIEKFRIFVLAGFSLSPSISGKLLIRLLLKIGHSCAVFQAVPGGTQMFFPLNK
ncbi:hypothetical protein [Burkholderia plantarii]|uniref:hypothetical protein n=1 Tax=Burkholderia plantarii TaxID=41899 RepID=UPI000AA07D94|nr:hypothetical protein [Burkholderia plantarii]